MGNVNQELEEIFNQLKECHEEIHEINGNPQKKQIIYKLHEAFELSSGAFYQLFLYQHFYNNLDIDNLNKTPHTECWNIIDISSNFSDFKENAIPGTPIIRSELRSSCISNAAVRISTASALICDTIAISKKLFRLNKMQYNKFWPFQEYLRIESDWNRKRLFNLFKRINKTPSNERERDFFFLMLIVALRDEYGHSEYSFKTNQEYRKKRGEIIDKHYKKWITDAEISIMKKNINTIIELCKLNQNPIKFNSSF